MDQKRQTFECFGLVLHGFSLEEALQRIELINAEGKQAFVVTANPEILLEAKRNPAYWQNLHQADLRLVDGFGLKLIGNLKGAHPTRVTGVNFAEALLQMAHTKNWKVALIGGADGIADKAAWDIRKSYPTLQITSEEGGMVDKNGSEDEKNAEAKFRLTQYAPDILLVAFGHPKQEAWIVRNLGELPSVKVAVGVGGTFDYWSGTKKRAPHVFQSFGLEWLWRLITEPSRWKRIWDAVIVFPIMALADKKTSK